MIVGTPLKDDEPIKNLHEGQPVPYQDPVELGNVVSPVTNRRLLLRSHLEETLANLESGQEFRISDNLQGIEDPFITQADFSVTYDSETKVYTVHPSSTEEKTDTPLFVLRSKGKWEEVTADTEFKPGATLNFADTSFRLLPNRTHLTKAELSVMDQLEVDEARGVSGTREQKPVKTYESRFGKAALISHCGGEHSKYQLSEDAALLIDLADGRVICGAVDGMGGHGGKEIPAQELVDRSVERTRNGERLSSVLEDSPKILFARHLTELAREHESVSKANPPSAEAQEISEGALRTARMGATFAFFEMEAGKEPDTVDVEISHAGDSRITVLIPKEDGSGYKIHFETIDDLSLFASGQQANCRWDNRRSLVSNGPNLEIEYHIRTEDIDGKKIDRIIESAHAKKIMRTLAELHKQLRELDDTVSALPAEAELNAEAVKSCSEFIMKVLENSVLITEDRSALLEAAEFFKEGSKISKQEAVDKLQDLQSHLGEEVLETVVPTTASTPHRKRLTLPKGAIVLACSDGLTDVVMPDEIQKIASEAESIADFVEKLDEQVDAEVSKLHFARDLLTTISADIASDPENSVLNPEKARACIKIIDDLLEDKHLVGDRRDVLNETRRIIADGEELNAVTNVKALQGISNLCLYLGVRTDNRTILAYQIELKAREGIAPDEQGVLIDPPEQIEIVPQKRPASLLDMIAGLGSPQSENQILDKLLEDVGLEPHYGSERNGISHQIERLMAVIEADNPVDIDDLHINLNYNSEEGCWEIKPLPLDTQTEKDFKYRVEGYGGAASVINMKTGIKLTPGSTLYLGSIELRMPYHNDDPRKASIKSPAYASPAEETSFSQLNCRAEISGFHISSGDTQKIAIVDSHIKQAKTTIALIDASSSEQGGDLLAEHLVELISLDSEAGESFEEINQGFYSGLKFLNIHATVHLKRQLPDSAAASLTALELTEGKASVIHGGDTRALIIRDGKVIADTKSSSTESARISFEYFDNCEEEGLPMLDFETQAGDQIVIASRSFWDKFSDEDIVEKLNSKKKSSVILAELQAELSESDTEVSCVIADIN